MPDVPVNTAGLSCESGDVHDENRAGGRDGERPAAWRAGESLDGAGESDDEQRQNEQEVAGFVGVEEKEACLKARTDEQEETADQVGLSECKVDDAEQEKEQGKRREEQKGLAAGGKEAQGGSGFFETAGGRGLVFCRAGVVKERVGVVLGLGQVLAVDCGVMALDGDEVKAGRHQDKRGQNGEQEAGEKLAVAKRGENAVQDEGNQQKGAEVVDVEERGCDGRVGEKHGLRWGTLDDDLPVQVEGNADEQEEKEVGADLERVDEQHGREGEEGGGESSENGADETAGEQINGGDGENADEYAEQPELGGAGAGHESPEMQEKVVDGRVEVAGAGVDDLPEGGSGHVGGIGFV